MLLRSLGRSYNAQPEDEKPTTVTETLTKLFEFVASIVEDQAAIVEEKFGPGSTVSMIKHLQLQSDVHAGKIIDLFFEHYRLQKTVSLKNIIKLNFYYFYYFYYIFILLFFNFLIIFFLLYF